MSDTLNVFISHKHEYEAAARTIKGILARLGASSLRAFISEEIPCGGEWYKWISDRLAESNVLLLLFTEPSSSWDWCLYEAGLFQRIGGSNFRRIICIHSPQTRPPDPLKHLQAVPATLDRVKQLLRNLFGGTELTGRHEAINPHFAQDDEALTREARAVCDAFNPVAKRTTHFNKFIEITVSGPDQISRTAIPAEATVKSDGPSLTIFGLTDGSWPWREIEAEARSHPDSRWVDELIVAVHEAARARLFRPIQATYKGVRGETYRPVLRRADLNADRSMTFHVMFVEEVSGQVGDLPPFFATLLTALSMGTRFRFEVIEKCLAAIRTMGAGMPRGSCESVKKAILDIEAEAALRGAELSEESLKNLFADPQQRSRIADCYTRWYRIREMLMGAIDRHDVGGVEAAMRELRSLNAGFMATASRRYHELVSEHMSGRPIRGDPEPLPLEEA